LPDDARELEREVDSLARRPRQAGRALRPAEGAHQPLRARLRQLRILAPRAELERELAAQLAAVGQDRLVAVLGHPAGAGRERELDELARRLEAEQVGLAVVAVERRLGRELPVAAEHRPAVLAAGDALAALAGVGVAAAEGRRAVHRGHDEVLAVAGSRIALEPDQLEPARPERELVVAAEL